MWFYCCEFYSRLSISECCHHEDILSCGHGEVGSDRYILLVIFSLECYIFSLTHILVSICCECLEMLIDRALSDIASSRIGDLERTEPLQESWEEEYPNTDLLDLLTIEVIDREM